MLNSARQHERQSKYNAAENGGELTKKGESLSKLLAITLVFVLLASTLGVLAWASGNNAMVAGSVDVSVEQPTAMIDSDTDVIALDVSAEDECEAGPIADVESSSSLSSEIDASLDAGKPVFLFFYADWCHFCQEEMPIIEELELEYAEEIVVIYVSNEDNSQAMTEFGVTGFPAMFLISSKGSDGEYRYQEFKGFTDKETLSQSFDWVITYGSIPEGSSADSDTRGEEIIAAIAANFSQDLRIRALQADECPDHCECLTDEEAEERELTLCDDEPTECTFYYPPLGIYVMGHCYQTEEYDFLTLYPAHPLPGERTTIELRDMDESKSDAAILYLDDRIVDVCAPDDTDYCQLEFIFSDDVEIYIAVAAEYGQDVSVFDRYGSPMIDALADFYGDDDDDGVINGVDNCRDDENADQADFDQDWVGDECDLCDPGRTKGIPLSESWHFYDSDGCGHDDTDADPGDDGRIHYTQGRLRRQNEDTTFNCTARPCKDAVTTLATDSCLGDTLQEFYFVDNDGNYADEEYHCWNGGCESGACLCHDTDGGKNYGEKGSVGLWDDWCWADGSHLHEFWVEMDVDADQCSRKSENHICDGSCQNGACVDPTCDDGVQNQGETNIDCGGPNCQSCDTVQVSGRIWYQEADAVDNGLTLGGFRPTRFVHVGLYDRSKTNEIAHTVTNSQGYFFFVVTRYPDAQYYVKVWAKNYAAVVIKDVDGACNEYIIWSSVSGRDKRIPQPPDNVDFGDLEIYPDGRPGGDFTGRWWEKHCWPRSKGDRVGGAQWFNIAEDILMAREYVSVHRVNPDDDSIARVWVQYPDDSWSRCNPYENEITLSSPGAGQGLDHGYMDSTIMHEYGHHIQYELSGWRAPNYNGALADHYMCQKVGDHETAFLEGWAHYFTHIVYYHALDYQDPAHGTIVSAVGYWSLGDNNPNTDDLQDGCANGNTGHKEGSVLTVLWNLADGTSSLPDYTPESWDRLSGLEDFIMSCLDRQMDDSTAPEVCELRQCATAAGVSLNDLNEILSVMGISDC